MYINSSGRRKSQEWTYIGGGSFIVTLLVSAAGNCTWEIWFSTEVWSEKFGNLCFLGE